MSGIDLDKLASEKPDIARAKAVVDFVNHVARLLRSMRAESGLSQAEMAYLLGVSQPRIAQLESGKPGNAPSVEQIAQYAFQCGKPLVIAEKFDAASEAIQMNRDLARDIRELHRSVQSLTEKLHTTTRSEPADAGVRAHSGGSLMDIISNSGELVAEAALAGAEEGAKAVSVIGKALAETNVGTKEGAAAVLAVEIQHTSDALRKAFEEAVASREYGTREYGTIIASEFVREGRIISDWGAFSLSDFARYIVMRALSETGSDVGSRVRDFARGTDKP